MYHLATKTLMLSSAISNKLWYFEYLKARSCAVSPREFLKVKSASLCISKSSNNGRVAPLRAARCNGVWPLSVCTFTEAPFLSKMAAVSTWSQLHALCRGCQLSLVFASMFAPFSNRICKCHKLFNNKVYCWHNPCNKLLCCRWR